MLKISNITRFVKAIASFMITLCLGTLYAWGVFIPHLEQEFGWTRAEVTIPFTVASLVFAFGMVLTGRLLDIKGPKIMVVMSAILVLVGYGLSSMTNTLWWLIITFGLIMGASIALGYMAGVGAGIKWFPDLKGTATGILVGGFGAGAAVFGPLSHFLIAEYGWRSTFFILGVVFAIIIGLTAIVISVPPGGWIPAGWDPAKATGARKPSPEYTGAEFPFKEMLKTKEFWLMWLQYVLVLCGGFGIIVHIKPAAMEFGGFTPAVAAGLVALVSVSNLAGRFIISPLSDIIGRLNAFKIIAILMMVATASAALAIVYNMPWLFYVMAIVGGNAFGGYLALSPAFTADMWGMENVGINYGAMFTGWGVASFVGPYYAGIMYDVTGSYVLSYATFAALCIPAIIITLLIKPGELKAAAIKRGILQNKTKE